jgi:hypothetical protein
MYCCSITSVRPQFRQYYVGGSPFWSRTVVVELNFQNFNFTKMDNNKKVDRSHDNIDIQLTNIYNDLNFWIMMAEKEGFNVSLKIKKNKMLYSYIDVSWSYP